MADPLARGAWTRRWHSNRTRTKRSATQSAPVQARLAARILSEASDGRKASSLQAYVSFIDLSTLFIYFASAAIGIAQRWLRVLTAHIACRLSRGLRGWKICPLLCHPEVLVYQGFGIPDHIQMVISGDSP
ncbi:protein of unknown function [Pararobbsia alpina]